METARLESQTSQARTPARRGLPGRTGSGSPGSGDVVVASFLGYGSRTGRRTPPGPERRAADAHREEQEQEPDRGGRGRAEQLRLVVEPDGVRARGDRHRAERVVRAQDGRGLAV